MPTPGSRPPEVGAVLPLPLRAVPPADPGEVILIHRGETWRYPSAEAFDAMMRRAVAHHTAPPAPARPDIQLIRVTPAHLLTLAALVALFGAGGAALAVAVML